MRAMGKMMKRVVTGAGVIAAVGLAVPGNAVADERAGDTPDGYRTKISSPVATYGWVEWNDYRDSDHGDDIDNFYVQDNWGDGLSIELRVYWKGKTYKAHAYGGETKKIDIGNVPNNEKVYWRACGWDNSQEIGCTPKYSFQE
ncbi:hypothetical protein ACFWIW_04355 [Amycolatopsis sp. NPDC058340]|uniref:hypothetical protein n=1 Tax=Amycolatopsis sp. NPDC058340 TaxID=3346453 RepID=UPI0036598818